MSKVLVTSSGGWGDEFDLEGCAIFNSREEWDNIVAGIPDKPHEAYFGSNEFVVFENRKDYLSHISVKEITDEEEATLRRLLDWKYGSYGLFVVNSENY